MAGSSTPAADKVSKTGAAAQPQRDTTSQKNKKITAGTEQDATTAAATVNDATYVATKEDAAAKVALATKAYTEAKEAYAAACKDTAAAAAASVEGCNQLKVCSVMGFFAWQRKTRAANACSHVQRSIGIAPHSCIRAVMAIVCTSVCTQKIEKSVSRS